MSAAPLDREDRTRAYGHDLFARLDRRGPTVFSSAWLDDQLMHWSMSDPALKVQMFRFIDALPNLRTSGEISQHLKEYIGEAGPGLPKWMRRAVGWLPESGAGGRLLAWAADVNAKRMARRFIAGSNIPEAVAAVAALLVSQLLMTALIHGFWGIVAMLLLFFIAFNILEASLPSLVSKIAPAQAKGTAMGVYNTSQAFGLFVGGAVGGFLSHNFGYGAVFAFGAALSAAWLYLAATMRAPQAVSSKMFHVAEMSADRARELTHKLMTVRGVAEAIVVAEEGVAYLKVNMAGWD